MQRFKVQRLFDFHNGMTEDGVKTKAIGDRARFGSHLLSNLLSSTGKQRRKGSGMTRRKREGRGSER